MFKITFNKPAVERWFGRETRGLELAFSAKSTHLFMRPINKIENDDDVELHPHGKGGLEAVIEGHGSERCLELLQNPYGNPYFELKEDPRAPGYLAVFPYIPNSSSPAIPRAGAVMRVWVEKDPKKAMAPNHLVKLDFSSFLKEIEEASDIMRGFESMGDPERRAPQDVVDARNKLQAFQRVAMRTPMFERLRVAHRHMGAMLDLNVAPVRPLDEVMNTAAPSKARAQMKQTAPDAARASGGRHDTGGSPQPSGQTMFDRILRSELA